MQPIVHFFPYKLCLVGADGPYGGTPCGATDHDHYGADDSIQKQWQNQADFYVEVGSSNGVEEGFLFVLVTALLLCLLE